MNAWIAFATFIMDILEKVVIPGIQAGVAKGEITPAQQQAVRDRYMAFKDNLDTFFSGPEWEIEIPPTPPTPPAPTPTPPP